MRLGLGLGLGFGLGLVAGLGLGLRFGSVPVSFSSTSPPAETRLTVYRRLYINGLRNPR